MSYKIDSYERIHKMTKCLYQKHSRELMPYYVKDTHIPIIINLLFAVSQKQKLNITVSKQILNEPIINLNIKDTEYTIISRPLIAHLVNQPVKLEEEIFLKLNQNEPKNMIDYFNSKYNKKTDINDQSCSLSSSSSSSAFDLIYDNKIFKFDEKEFRKTQYQEIQFIQLQRLILTACHWWNHVDKNISFSKFCRISEKIE